MNPIPEKGGYAAGGRTVSELPPPPPSVSIREVRPETMTHDDLAATLEEIRRDAKDETEGLGPTRRASKRDAPRLVAALEAVLKLAGDWDAKAKEIGGQIRLEDCDGAVAGFKMIGYQQHRDHAAALRESIARALTGDTDA